MRLLAPRVLFLVIFAVVGLTTISVAQPVGSEFQVNTYTTSAQRTTRGRHVAVHPAGNFVVVWTGYGQDGSGSGIFAQRYDSDGDALGAEFRVNTYTTN